LSNQWPKLGSIRASKALANNNKVRQLFYAEENGVHYVNLKLKTPISRTRAVSALRELEGITINMFELPPGARTWNSVIFTLPELSGEGAFIRRIILQHKNDGRADFYQYLAPRFRHDTIMLNHTALPNTAPLVVGVVSRTSSNVTEIYIPTQIEEVVRDDRPRAVLHGVQVIPETWSDGSRNTVLEGVRLTKEIVFHLAHFYNIPYGTNVLNMLENIHTRMGEMDSRIGVIEGMLSEIRDMFRR
jgi:hypothetical protein